MAIVLVPHSVTQSSANLWLGSTDSPAPPASFAVNIEGRPPIPVPSGGWRLVTAGGMLPAAERRTWVRTVKAEGLPAGTAFVATAHGSLARFATLPLALPRPGQTPFTVLLGSCYAAHNDRGVGPMIDRIAATLRPSVKLLVGDQVYLDQQGFLPSIPFTGEGTARDFLAKYLRNWSDASGFHKVLREGATWFTPDDHEYWNNYPNAATAHPRTWFEGGRNGIKAVARSLYEDFQSDGSAPPGKPRVFAAGVVEFFVTDSRTNRESGDTSFQAAVDHAALLAWIAGLRGPGVLVLSQPLFVNAASGFSARFADRTLANYRRQYPEIANALRRAAHSVLVLSGDVHFGRVAETTDLVVREVIASPAAVVFGEPPNTQSAPGMFPAESAGAAQVPVRTIDDSRRAGDQFATLEFTEASGIVDVTVRQWYIREPDRPPVPIRFRMM